MEKCWFILRQTHYPAPEYTRLGMAYGEAVGPLRLGHFIPSPRAVDQVINSDGITPFPRDMPIWPTTAVDFRFSNRAEKDVETSAKVGVPIAAAAGVTVNAEAGLVFRRIMGDTWAMDRLDTQIVQPTMAYLAKCRKSTQVAKWVEAKQLLGIWKVYMVSGLIIARGARHERNETIETGEHGGVGVDVPGVATVETNLRHTNKKEAGVAGQEMTDFVWAVRLSEVSKGFFDSNLSQKIVTKGTVFAPKSDELEIKTLLDEQNLFGEDTHATEVFAGDEQQFLLTIEGV